MIDSSGTIHYTDEQAKVIFSDSKVNIVCSVPGSGKSFVLLERAKRLVDEYNENILIVTFTNNAVDDLINKLPSEYSHRITIKTIHSYCLALLQNNLDKLNLFFGCEKFKELKINENDFENFKEFLGKNKDHEKEYEKIIYLRSLSSPPQTLLNLIKKGIYFNNIIKELDVKTFRDYEFDRLSKGYVLYDDLILLTRSLMSLPEVSVPVLTKYDHILVDEAQDTSQEQWEILRPLIAHCRTSLVVGDVNQSIYEWRGASASSMMNLGFLRDSITFRMTKSFRNPQAVAALANEICVDKSSKITTDKEGSVQIRPFDTHEAEIDWVFKNLKLGDVVIARTNAILEQMEQKLLDSNIPYNGSSFQKDQHIIDLVDYCREHRQSTGLVEKLKTDFLSLRKYSKLELEDLNYFIIKIKERGCGFLLRDRFESKHCVTLSTGHSAKGLEWDRVFLIGMDQKTMPHRLVKDQKEELNLFYVMITRARKDLIITYAGEKSKFLNGVQGGRQ